MAYLNTRMKYCVANMTFTKHQYTNTCNDWSRGQQENLSGSRDSGTADYCPRQSRRYSQLFPGLTESREPDGFFCWPRDQSLFVLLYHYMPTVHKIAIHNKLTTMLNDAFQFKIYFK